MPFSSKNDALNNLTSAITTDSDVKLQPTTTRPIKASNIQNYLQNFLDWLFPPNVSSSDLSGKVLGVGRTSLTTNTNYANLQWLTMMPLGGIIMYPLDGKNFNNGGVFTARIGASSISNSSPELDGFLFLDGSVIDTNVVGNEKYKDLKKILNGYYENVNTDSLLKLPNMQNRVPLGYNPSSPTTPNNFSLLNSQSTASVVNNGKCGNSGGYNSISLLTTQLPQHNHSLLESQGATVSVSGGSHTHSFSNGSPASYETSLNYSYVTSIGLSYRRNTNLLPSTHTHPTSEFSGNTANSGTGQVHENRMPYMVLNYAIKY